MQRLLGTLVASAVLALITPHALSADQNPSSTDDVVAELVIDPSAGDDVDLENIADVLRQAADVNAIPVTGAGTVLVRSDSTRVERARQLFKTLMARAQDWREVTRKKEAEEEARTRELEKAEAAQIAKNTISLDFPGGTIGQFIEALGKQTSTVNVVFGSNETRDLEMPKVQVRAVTATAALSILESLPFKSGNNIVHVEVDRLPGDPDGIAGGPAAPMVFVARMTGATAAPPPSSQETRVFNLSVLQRHDQAALKGLLSALETAATLNGKSPNYSIKFHEGSGLLFVRGSGDDISMAEQVVQSVMGNSNKNPPSNEGR